MNDHPALFPWFLAFYVAGAATVLLVVLMGTVLSLLRRVALHTREAAAHLDVMLVRVVAPAAAATTTRPPRRTAARRRKDTS